MVDLTASRMREEIRAGRWREILPGVRLLASEYEVSHPVVRSAMNCLEKEGILIAGGRGRARSVARLPESSGRQVLRVKILLDVKFDEQDSWFQATLERIQRNLEVEGHVCQFSDQCLSELNHDATKIRRHVENQVADAWVVVGGMEDTLSWLMTRSAPVIAIGGRCGTLRIASAGRDNFNAFREVCQLLTGLGHRRVVFISSREMRHPGPSWHVKALIKELEACGAVSSPYNFPEWDESPDGLMRLLEKMFHLTPPTAILVEDANWLTGVLAFLAQRGLRVPQDVSLVCLTYDTSFLWQRPTIAHLATDDEQMADRVVRWVEETACGRGDCDCIPDHARGSIGSVAS